MTELNVTLSLSIKTCRCGTVYAIPNWVSSYDCPTCAERSRMAVQDDLDASYIENIRLGHVIASLKGVITKMRRKP